MYEHFFYPAALLKNNNINCFKHDTENDIKVKATWNH